MVSLASSELGSETGACLGCRLSNTLVAMQRSGQITSVTAAGR